MGQDTLMGEVADTTSQASRRHRGTRPSHLEEDAQGGLAAGLHLEEQASPTNKLASEEQGSIRGTS